MPQEAKREEPSIEQELAALIEKTNALESFHLVYEAQVKEEGKDKTEEFTIELTHRAPDLGRARFLSHEGESDSWVVGKDMYLLTDGRWRHAVLPWPPSGALLDELFPPEDRPLGPGLSLRFIAGDDADSRKGFTLTFQTIHSGRSAVLDWLRAMVGQPSEVSIEDGAFLWAWDAYRCFVSRETGLIERVEVTSGSEHMTLRLLESQSDQSLDSALFTLPAQAKAAPIDPELSRSVEKGYGPDAIRRNALLRVERQLDSGKREWNELARNDWLKFLDVLHREVIVNQFSGWLEKLEKHGDGFAEWVRARRAQDDSPESRDKLQQALAEARDKLLKGFDQSEAKYKEALPPIESKEAEPRQELLDIELEVIAQLYDELVRRPALESFDLKVSAALEE